MFCSVVDVAAHSVRVSGGDTKNLTQLIKERIMADLIGSGSLDEIKDDLGGLLTGSLEGSIGGGEDPAPGGE